MILPCFETERLILKEITLDDVVSYQMHFADYEVISQLSHHVPWPYPDNGAEDFIKKSILPKQGKNYWMWGLFLKTNPSEIIGAVHLWAPGTPENRGFWLGRKFWGQGLMTEATKPITDYAFNYLGFNELIFANAVGNIKSRRVKEKAGAKLLRIEPARFVNPDYAEHEVWLLTQQDWAKLKN